MRLEVLAAALQSVYSNGRVKSAKKLDRRDFVIIVTAALGAFMRKVYYEERGIGSIMDYFGSILTEKEYEVEEDNYHRRTIDLSEDKIVKLPKNTGIYSVTPLDNEGYVIEDQEFTKLGAGMDYLFQTDDLDDIGTQTYQVISNKILFKNMFNDTKKVLVKGLYLDDNFEIPEDVAYSIMNDVFTKVVPLQGYPIDKTDDGNPNLIEYKRRLAEQDQL